MRDVFANAGYRRLWAARTVSQWGDASTTVALALLVYDLTGSGSGVTAVVAVEILPVLLLGPVAGALVDRLPRVRVMMAADLVRALTFTALARAPGDVRLAFVVAFASSLATVSFNPAAGPVLPGLLSKDQLIAGNTGIWTAAVLSQLAIAPLAGLTVVTAGYSWAFAANAASCVISALLLHRLHTTAPVARLQRRHLLTEAVEGVGVVRGDRTLRALAVASCWLPSQPGRPAHCSSCTPSSASR